MNFLRLFSLLVAGVYITLPALAVFAAIKRRRPRAITGVVGSCVCGMALGWAVSQTFASIVGGDLSAGQIFLAGYFAIAMLLVFRGLDWLVLAALAFAAGKLFPPGNSAPAPGGRVVDHANRPWFLLARTLILSIVGVPYLLSAVMIYRPKIVPKDSPITYFQSPFQTIHFESADGISLTGWWIPANFKTNRVQKTTQDLSADDSSSADSSGEDLSGEDLSGTPSASAASGQISPDRQGELARTTAIICHGFGLTKASELETARVMNNAGYNVLMFDFRAHGESGGQISTFGDRERFDVLAAVAWARREHAEESRRIIGVGSGTGAAALIAAAADPSTEGRAIEALAVFGSYDSLPALMDSLTDDYVAPPVGWLFRYIGLPMASLQAGTDLSDFSPARDTLEVAPRPVFFVHDVRDQVIDFDRGKALFDAAPAPKARFWINGAAQDEAAQKADAIGQMLWFFENARPML